MRISAKDELSLRIMVRLANDGQLSISQISELEKITEANVAKITRLLRKAELLKSIHGPQGGYELACPAKEITLDKIISAVEGSLYGKDYCEASHGECNSCIHIEECSIRPLWSFIQKEINQVLSRLTLHDLTKSEAGVIRMLS